ncbi:MAG: hypothetical protein HYU37_17245 [Acidobacteria bacterium]|nr:hypothetical protein [Acidobacteriota bacterium]
MPAARRLFVIGLALWALAALAYGTVRLTFGPRPVYVNVRWADGVDAAARQRLEQRYGLADGELREGTTWGYALTDRSRTNIRALVEDPAVTDTHQIHRTAFRVGYFAQRLPYRTSRRWIPVTLEGLSLLALGLGCIAVGLGALERVVPRAVRGPLAGLRSAFLTPVAAASRLIEPLTRWTAGRIPSATAEAVAGFRIVFGTALLLYLLKHDVGAADVDPTADALVVGLLGHAPWIADWMTTWLIVWSLLFIAGAAARLSFVMLAVGVFTWADLYTIDISHHTVSALMVTLVCLLGSRWGDAWSVDSWRARTAGPKGPALRAAGTPQEYGFTVWIPSFVLGVAFAAAAIAKLYQGGIGWILNGTVKYHFLSDSREALVDWGLRAARHDEVAVLLSFGAIVIEGLVIVGVLARRYTFRLAAGIASMLLLSGFVLFQGVIWPGWWMLLLSFLPWHRVTPAGLPRLDRARGETRPTSPASWPRPLYPAIIVLALMAEQATVSLLRLEVSPMLSAYDMYSTTYASPADFEAKAADAHWLVAVDDSGRRHQCRLTREEAESLTMGSPAGGTLPSALRQRCLDPSLRVKALTVEADRIRVDWARLRLEETGRVALRSFVIRDY